MSCHFKHFKASDFLNRFQLIGNFLTLHSFCAATALLSLFCFLPNTVFLTLNSHFLPCPVEKSLLFNLFLYLPIPPLGCHLPSTFFKYKAQFLQLLAKYLTNFLYDFLPLSLSVITTLVF